MSDHSHDHAAHGPADAEPGLHHVESNKKEIWKIFFVLLAITVLEFLIALTPAIRGLMTKTVIAGIFLGLTVLKAYYIVAYFMHLKHEKFNMAITILLPIAFILYLIALLLMEGNLSY